MPEYHGTASTVFDYAPRPPEPPPPNGTQPHKAVVLLFLKGGMDSFNLLVPWSHCNNGTDLYAEYKELRGAARLDEKKAYAPRAKRISQTTISVNASEQPCGTFAIHPSFQFLKEAYEAKEASLVANIGTLTEPLTMEEYKASRDKRPRGLFAHNLQQEVIQSMHPQHHGARGILGRMVDELKQTYRVGSYSIAGNVKAVEGATRSATISAKNGVVNYGARDELGGEIASLQHEASTSVISQTYTDALAGAIESADLLVASMAQAKLSEKFDQPEATKVGRQFEQIAKIISRNTELGGDIDSQRDVFFVEVGGFDTHNDLGEHLEESFVDMDYALRNFKAELQSMRKPDGSNKWSDVVIVEASDFGRTLTTNGLGTDHGYGGNSFVVGGGLSGKKAGHVLGHFPPSFADRKSWDVGRGRPLPTTPWEAPWKEVARWFGVDTPEQMGRILPNVGNFDVQLFEEGALFE